MCGEFALNVYMLYQTSPLFANKRKVAGFFLVTLNELTFVWFMFLLFTLKKITTVIMAES